MTVPLLTGWFRRTTTVKLEMSAMRSILFATAILSASSAVTIVAGIVTTKVVAVRLGPSGYGLVGMLQSMLSLIGLVSGLGLGPALVREIGNALARDNTCQIGALKRAAYFLVTASCVVAAVSMIIWREQISYWVLGTRDQGANVALVAPALCLSLATSVEIGILNAYHRIKTLATVATANALLGSATTILIVWIWGVGGAAPAIITAAAANYGVARYFRFRVLGHLACPSGRNLLLEAQALLHFGGVYSLATFASTGVQMALPIIILRTLGIESVGYYRAAMGLAVSYLSFLLNSMSQDYLPRVASAVSARDLRSLVNQQQRFVLLLAAPIILVALAFIPYIIPLVYSPSFSPAVSVLEWYLIGDLFKLSSWSMSYVVLIRSSRKVYLATEVFAGVTMLGSTAVGLKWFGLPGVGVAFLFSYIAYYSLVWAVVRREIDFSWTSTNRWMLAGAVGSALLQKAAGFGPWARWQSQISMCVAATAVMGSLWYLSREVGAGDVVRRLRGSLAKGRRWA